MQLNQPNDLNAQMQPPVSAIDSPLDLNSPGMGMDSKSPMSMRPLSSGATSPFEVPGLSDDGGGSNGDSGKKDDPLAIDMKGNADLKGIATTLENSIEQLIKNNPTSVDQFGEELSKAIETARTQLSGLDGFSDNGLLQPKSNDGNNPNKAADGLDVNGDDATDPGKKGAQAGGDLDPGKDKSDDKDKGKKDKVAGEMDVNGDDAADPGKQNGAQAGGDLDPGKDKSHDKHTGKKDKAADGVDVNGDDAADPGKKGAQAGGDLDPGKDKSDDKDKGKKDKAADGVDVNGDDVADPGKQNGAQAGGDLDPAKDKSDDKDKGKKDKAAGGMDVNGDDAADPGKQNGTQAGGELDPAKDKSDDKDNKDKVAAGDVDLNGDGTTPPGSNPPASGNSDPQAAGMDAFEQEVVDRTNQFRQQNGLNPLTVDPKLAAAAEKHSQAMSDQDFFSHTGKDGSSFSDRLEREGYQFSTAGENIAAGQPTPEEVVQAWIDSPGHRANLLNPNFEEIGIGFVNNPNDTGNVNFKTYWSQEFGTERTA